MEVQLLPGVVCLPLKPVLHTSGCPVPMSLRSGSGRPREGKCFAHSAGEGQPPLCVGAELVAASCQQHRGAVLIQAPSRQI